MILIFDSETSGLYNFNLPHVHPAQPHLVQLGALLMEDDGTPLQSVDLIVRPEGYTIPSAAAAVHGITTEIAERVGIPLIVVIGAFLHLRSKADTIVAHNLPFDERIMDTAIARAGKTVTLQAPCKRACTMEMAEPILKIPATAKMITAGYGHKFKKPNLGECIQYFFNEKIVGAHNALSDAQACARVYFAIVRGKPPVQGVSNALRPL